MNVGESKDRFKILRKELNYSNNNNSLGLLRNIHTREKFSNTGNMLKSRNNGDQKDKNIAARDYITNNESLNINKFSHRAKKNSWQNKQVEPTTFRAPSDIYTDLKASNTNYNFKMTKNVDMLNMSSKGGFNHHLSSNFNPSLMKNIKHVQSRRSLEVTTTKDERDKRTERETEGMVNDVESQEGSYMKVVRVVVDGTELPLNEIHQKLHDAEMLLDEITEWADENEEEVEEIYQTGPWPF